MQAEHKRDMVKNHNLAQSLFDCCMLVLIGMVAAKLMWLVFAPADYVAKPVSLPAQTNGEAAAQLASAAINLAILTDKNPFGADSGVSPKGEVSGARSAPQTTLDVTLKGVRHSTDQAQGGAFIQLSSGEEAFVRVGDYIVADVIVDQILPGQIILRRNGNRESLAIRAEEDRVLVAYAGASEAEPRVLFSEGEQTGRSRQGGPSSAPETFRAEIDNPAQLLSSVRLDAFSEGSRIIGYRVSPRGDQEPMQAVGFNRGDIILAVNGRSVAQLDERELTDMLSFSQRLRFNVLRDEAELQIILSIKGAN